MAPITDDGGGFRRVSAAWGRDRDRIPIVDPRADIAAMDAADESSTSRYLRDAFARVLEKVDELLHRISERDASHGHN